ncbi:MAG: hypothetical protein Q9181_007761, partial [Wetmoreana brouardii]
IEQIDWNAVATELEITNGHAARMRYSRFKQQMEGITPQVRKPRATKSGDKADGTAKAKKKRKRDDETQVDDEDTGVSTPMAGVESTAPSVKPEPAVKDKASVKLEQIKPEPVVKEESTETGFGSLPAARLESQTPMVGCLTTHPWLEPAPDFFALPEDLQMGLEANTPSARQDLQLGSRKANTPSVPQDLQPRPEVNAPLVPQTIKKEADVKVKTEHET